MPLNVPPESRTVPEVYSSVTPLVAVKVPPRISSVPPVIAMARELSVSN